MAETIEAGRIAEELRQLVSDAEALLGAGLGSGAAEAQARAQETLAGLKERLGGLEQQLNVRAQEVDSYVRENPWQAVAIAGGVALFLGLLMGRR
ncbi:MAG TPA: hypothetical protein VH109_02970 [Steroidobacteraceae bacterium]|jgi:ElaB/YqjD/DUF883 family membrane-anchored ribosome-binding protein|nr:hypothetical protein [Steroidobacteraceae bacterium]